MAALQCEFCGGKLKTKAGGICECDSCGMEYDKDWVKEKIQEIKGTVKVEGTVEVTGKVQVDNSAALQNLLKRGFMELEDGHAKTAQETFNRAKDIDAGYGDIYVGLLMCKVGKFGYVKTRSEFRTRLLSHDFDQHTHFQKIMTCPGSEMLKEEVAAYRARLAEEEQERKARSLRGMERAEEFRLLREKYSPVRQMITENGFALNMNGDPVCLKGYGNQLLKASWKKPWENMLAIVSDYHIEMGICGNGTVVAEIDFGDSDNPEVRKVKLFAPDDQIVQVSSAMEYQSGVAYFVGLRRDGTVSCKVFKKDWETSVASDHNLNKSDWKDIAALCDNDWLCAVRKDGVYLENSYHGLLFPKDLVWVAQSARNEPRMLLHRDGTVSVLRENKLTKLDWENIIQITPHCGLKADGTIEWMGLSDQTQYALSYWENIVFIRECISGIFGVKRDGTVVGTGTMLKVDGVKLFDNIDTLEATLSQRREKAYSEWKREKEEKEVRLMELEKEESMLKEELANLKGVFSILRRKELERKLETICSRKNEIKAWDQL